MVRLKACTFYMKFEYKDEFQFLNGAIKRAIPAFSGIKVHEFQFLNGAIKSKLKNL